MSKSFERCCVKGCNSTSGKNKDVSFHRFPNPKKQKVEGIDRLRVWRKVLKVDTLHLRMRVCSLHFKRDDYILPDFPSRHKMLVKSAVPSVNLPLTNHEKENLIRKELRLNRIIQRNLREHSNYNESVSSECDMQVADTVMREQCNYDKSVSSESVVQVVDIPMNEEYNVAIANQPAKIAKSEVLESEDPVLSLIEKNKKIVKEKEYYSFIDTLNTDEKMCTATGIPEIKILDTVVKMVKEVYGNRFEKYKLKTRSRIVLTYMKMKHNTSYRLLALIFTCTSPQVCQKIFFETIQALNNILSIAIPWPSREEISRNLPICFEGFEDTRIVLDCTEIFIQQPKNLCCQLKTYSHYKGVTTVKFLIGVSPAGLITFVSPAFGGRPSDTAIFSHSKLINLLEPGDGIMVDRGFSIDKLCQKNRWKCIRPPSLQDKKQFSQSQSLATSKIAAARVHIERVNQRIKVWSIVGSRMPVNLVPIASEIFNVLCATINISDSILSDDKFMNIG